MVSLIIRRSAGVSTLRSVVWIVGLYSTGELAITLGAGVVAVFSIVDWRHWLVAGAVSAANLAQTCVSQYDRYSFFPRIKALRLG